MLRCRNTRLHGGRSLTSGRSSALQMERSHERIGRSWAILAGEATLLCVLAVAIRIPGLAAEALHDELYSFLAAQGLLASGSPIISAGGEPYTRAFPFTLIVSGFMAALGESLTVARLPSVVFGTLTAAITFLWLRSRGARVAAWIAGGLVAIDPTLLELSGVSRFYTLQNAAFLLGCIGLFELLSRKMRASSRILVGGSSAAALLLALELQVITLIGIAGAAVYALFVIVPRLRTRFGLRAFQLLVGMALAIALLALAVTWSGLGREAFQLASYSDPWAAGTRGAYRYYVGLLLESYAPVWALFPLIAVLAAIRNARVTGLAFAVFVTALVTHSLLAWKAERYISYAMPFFFIIAGLGVAEAVSRLGRLAKELSGSLAPRFSKSDSATTLLVRSIVFLTIGFAAVNTRAFIRAADLVFVADRSASFPMQGPGEPPISWNRASSTLSTIEDSVDVVVSSSDLKAIYYLGRLDYVISRDQLVSRQGDLPEFHVDPVLNRPIISTPASVAAIIGRHETGLVVVESVHWRSWAVPSETADTIQVRMERVRLAPQWGILAFRWPRQNALSDAAR